MKDIKDLIENIVKYSSWPVAAVLISYFLASYSWTPLKFQYEYNGPLPTSISDSNGTRQTERQQPENALPSIEEGAKEYLDYARKLEEEKKRQTDNVAQTSAANPVQTQRTDERAQILGKDTSLAIANILMANEAIDDFNKDINPAKIIFAFFDPRCPFCSNAFKSLHGKYPVKWIPISYFQDKEEGARLNSALLSSQNRIAAMTDHAENNKLDQVTADIVSHYAPEIEKNTQSFVEIVSGATTVQPAIPFFLVPSKEGLEIMVGFGDDTESEINKVYHFEDK